MRPKTSAMQFASVLGSGIVAMMMAFPAMADNMKSGGNAGGTPSHATRTTQGAADLTIDTVRYDQLSPQVQAAIEGRTGPEQKISELIETTILNRLAVLGDGYTLDETRRAGPDYVLIVSDPDGQQATMLYVVDTDELREVQM